MPLKLYVVGETTADPKEWSMWSEYALVIAANETDARRIAERGDDASLAEIPMDKPLFLIGMTEPNHGDDI